MIKTIDDFKKEYDALYAKHMKVQKLRTELDDVTSKIQEIQGQIDNPKVIVDIKTSAKLPAEKSAYERLEDVLIQQLDQAQTDYDQFNRTVGEELHNFREDEISNRVRGDQDLEKQRLAYVDAMAKAATIADELEGLYQEKISEFKQDFRDYEEAKQIDTYSNYGGYNQSNSLSDSFYGSPWYNRLNTDVRDYDSPDKLDKHKVRQGLTSLSMAPEPTADPFKAYAYKTLK